MTQIIIKQNNRNNLIQIKLLIITFQKLYLNLISQVLNHISKYIDPKAMDRLKPKENWGETTGQKWEKSNLRVKSRPNEPKELYINR